MNSLRLWSLAAALAATAAITIGCAAPAPSLPPEPRITAAGVGSREIIIGLGTDDLRDALDRRVEFRTVDCS